MLYLHLGPILEGLLRTFATSLQVDLQKLIFNKKIEDTLHHVPCPLVSSLSFSTVGVVPPSWDSEGFLNIVLVKVLLQRPLLGAAMLEC